MTPEQFFHLTAKVRLLQDTYFKTRSNSVLRECRKLEKVLDAEIERVNKIIEKRKQPELFP